MIRVIPIVRNASEDVVSVFLAGWVRHHALRGVRTGQSTAVARRVVQRAASHWRGGTPMAGGCRGTLAGCYFHKVNGVRQFMKTFCGGAYCSGRERRQCWHWRYLVGGGC